MHGKQSEQCRAKRARTHYRCINNGIGKRWMADMHYHLCHTSNLWFEMSQSCVSRDIMQKFYLCCTFLVTWHLFQTWTIWLTLFTYECMYACGLHLLQYRQYRCTHCTPNFTYDLMIRHAQRRLYIIIYIVTHRTIYERV
jgi:hypothetical protein